MKQVICVQAKGNEGVLTNGQVYTVMHEEPYYYWLLGVPEGWCLKYRFEPYVTMTIGWAVRVMCAGTTYYSGRPHWGLTRTRHMFSTLRAAWGAAYSARREGAPAAVVVRVFRRVK